MVVGLGRIEWLALLAVDAEGAVAASGNGPHLGAGERIDLFDRAVGHS